MGGRRGWVGGEGTRALEMCNDDAATNGRIPLTRQMRLQSPEHVGCTVATTSVVEMSFQHCVAMTLTMKIV